MPSKVTDQEILKQLNMQDDQAIQPPVSEPTISAQPETAIPYGQLKMMPRSKLTPADMQRLRQGPNVPRGTSETAPNTPTVAQEEAAQGENGATLPTASPEAGNASKLAPVALPQKKSAGSTVTTPPSPERSKGETLKQWANRLYSMLSPEETAEAGEVGAATALRDRKKVIDAAIAEPVRVAQAEAPKTDNEGEKYTPDNYPGSIDTQTGRKVTIQIQNDGKYRYWDDANGQWVAIPENQRGRYEVNQ